MRIKSVAILNPVTTGSTGKIAVGLLKHLLAKNIDAIFCYGRGDRIAEEGFHLMEHKWEIYMHVILTRLFGGQGGYSKFATLRLIKLLRKRRVDTIYVVLLHGYYINEKMLFDYIAKDNIRLVYLMADEYPYLGKCAFADGCDRYKIGCGQCPHIKDYPASWFFDRSTHVWNRKMEAYGKISHLVFVAPKFVIDNAKNTPLMEGKNLTILDEAVNLDVFYPRDTTKLKKRLGIDNDKMVIVCVAPYPYARKGTQYFIELARMFEEKDKYIFVHVGCWRTPVGHSSNYIPIGYVNNEEELAEYFSLGDVFVFPSLDDTMPNACLDALGCGTPLLCFDISGMPFIAEPPIGTFVEPHNVHAMAEVVMKLKPKDEKIIKRCRDYALVRYDAKKYNDRLIRIAESL